MEQESAAKKQLDFADEKAGKIYASREGTPPPPSSARELKRPKKHVGAKKDKPENSSAASEVEDRQVQ
jgi:hypothetical protein